MKGFEKPVIAILTAHGFTLLRPGKGSHAIWSNGKIAVSVNHVCASRHTANGILRDAGIKQKI